MTSVLEGISVLDLSHGVAGPIATMLLADNGAAVTRIESPEPDPFATWPGSRVWARGKRSAVLDLEQSTDHEQFLALASRADVVVESFRPGVTTRLGIDYAALSARNPRLIYCSITGYGRGNRHSDRPAYDALVAARLGLQREQRSWPGGPIDHIHGLEPPVPDLELPPGCAPGSPRSGPIFSYSTWPSLATAYLANTGINAALLARESTGRGQLVETSLLQGAMALTMGKWMRVENPYATGFRMWITDRRAPKGHFECSDGRWIQQWVPNPMFVLSSADGDTLESRRGISNVRNDPDRVGNDPENVLVLAHYHPEMAAAMKRFPSTDWVRVAREYGTPLQQIRTPEEALCDQALIDEGVVVDVDDPELGRLRHVGIVYRLHETPGRVQGAAPRKGQHTDVVKCRGRRDPRCRWHRRHPGRHRAQRDRHRAGRSPRRRDGDRPRLRGGRPVRHTGARRPRRHRHQGQRAGATRGGMPLTSRTAPTAASAASASTSRRRGRHGSVAPARRPRRRGALEHAATRRRCASASTRSRCARSIPRHHLLPHPRIRRGPRSDSARQRSDRHARSPASRVRRRRHVATAEMPFWSLTSTRRHRQRLPLGDRRDPGALSPAAHGESGRRSTLRSSMPGCLRRRTAAVDGDGTALPRPHLDRMQLGLLRGTGSTRRRTDGCASRR